MQAVAAAVRADRAIFKHCRFLGHQDTLFADYGRQYYVDSYIEGGVDFIFGNATAATRGATEVLKASKARNVEYGAALALAIAIATAALEAFQDNKALPVRPLCDKDCWTALYLW